jgi:hypothetical protein
MEPIKHFLKRQLFAKNGYLVVAAICYAPLAALLLYISMPVVMLLVKFNLDNGYSTLTIEQWANAVPIWTGNLMNLCALLIVILLIWVLANFVQYPAEFVYSTWKKSLEH